MQRKGIVLAGGSGTRLRPLSLAVSKQLMPIYDKPMVYYPLSVLMLAGLREILIITTPLDLPAFQRLLGDGARFGVRFEYAVQPVPGGIAQALLLAERFLDGAPCALILGDNLFYGAHFVDTLKAADARVDRATIFGYRVSNPTDYGVVEISPDRRALSIEEKPAQPRSDYAVTGLYFYDAQASRLARALRPSPRGELEITDLNRLYLERDQLYVELLSRGTAWLDTGTPAALLDAASFVHVIERRQGVKIACLEEIALRQGWITPSRLQDHISPNGGAYDAYLWSLVR